MIGPLMDDVHRPLHDMMLDETTVEDVEKALAELDHDRECVACAVVRTRLTILEGYE